MEVSKRLRREYRLNIKTAKIESVRRELKEATSEDPWGMAHRMMPRKRRATVQETIKDK